MSTQVYLPNAEDFQCPLGHPVAFITNTPDEYTGSGALCDICDLRISRRWQQGVYHCTRQDCMATHPCRGWDMCVDCAVRKVIHMNHTLLNESSQQMQRQNSSSLGMLSRRPTNVMLTSPEDQSTCELQRLPFDAILCIAAFSTPKDLAALMLTNHTLLHIIGVAGDDSLFQKTCGSCGEHISGDRRIPLCTQCSRVFHATCCAHTTKCPVCPHPILPGAQMSFRTLSMKCKLCKYYHHYQLPPLFSSYRVMHSGNQHLDGVYHPCLLPSDGVTLYLRSQESTVPSQPSPGVPSICRMGGTWRVGFLGVKSPEDTWQWKSPGASQDEPPVSSPELQWERISTGALPTAVLNLLKKSIIVEKL